MRWRLRNHFFHGAGDYVFEVGNEKLSLAVDADGRFETDHRPPAPFGVFAKQVVDNSSIKV
jgi:hypothetical protein